MRYLDFDKWIRNEQYKLFMSMDYPQFNVCANVDITRLYSSVKKERLSFYNTMIYIASRAANNFDEFKYRIQGDKIVIHDIVSPSFTTLASEDAFSFCTVTYEKDFFKFYKDISLKVENLKGKVDLHDEPGRDDLLYITCIPWVSFTSISHPVHLKPSDSIPRISWGKYFQEGSRLKMPFSVQVNHALMDGLHVGRYFKALQDLLGETDWMDDIGKLVGK